MRQRLHRTCVLWLLVLFTATMSAAIGWTTVAPLPTNRVGFAAVTAADGKIYAIAGLSDGGNQPLAANESYNPGTNTWTAKAAIPTARSLPGAALSQDGKIYVVGGYAGGYSGTVEAYDPATNTWSGPLASMPTGRYELVVVAAGQLTDERIYAMGGFNNNGGARSEVEAYDPATNTWTTVAPLPAPRRGMAAVRGPDGLVYAIGGTPSVLGAPAGTVDAYDPATNTWSSKSPMTTARAYHAAAVGGDGLIYVMGGNFSPVLASVEAYNPVTDTWTTVASMPSARYALAAAAAPDGRVFAIGGGGGGNEVDALVLSGGTVAPSPLNFGTQGIGTSSAEQSVTLTSDGTLPLIVGAVGISGPNAGDFGIVTDSCTGHTFAPGASCVISIAFTPTALGGRNASLAVPDNSAVHNHTVPLSGTGVINDTTPPVLTLPPDFAVNADSPNGAMVSYVVTAVDPDDAVASLSCSPPSGSLFAIGTTSVSCTASDTHGNTSAPGTFHVLVKGADAQLADLIAAVQGLNLQQGIANSLDAKLQNAEAALAAAKAGNLSTACSLLGAFVNEVQAQSGKKITAVQAADLIAAANQIKSVLGCP